ncbi:uncharacterized protein BO66DRAFT_434095 [Aspergillus aculeatinus CBS 121060]|uniref:Uncharacterized protein n=2 Tax=Aspergillus subgen. Circumdati TaxID=2720871 RepID=A0ACD1HNI7_9EURO|nr:hypothetical protein BO95DRAFT_480918 [Aspergillus brunneoviolaceus CBS 621.78]XP_025508812.1 hypothetical protein BO66DRAFT_434095 [Aspergillus aculeatinus CBS 121060]RAH47458.1 hypothetical protein BO95DRAFT_480918 [Aspergillus brunneoviolaceus CBS 621.78]RAH74989.1 hypothetical protein BO66DRAFT_434095 [Aspergillus aculeatinus CBS 121060]
MDVFYAYTYSTAGWLGLQSLALIAVPEMMTTMLLTETRDPSSLETYFSRCLGFSLLLIAVLTVMLTGSVPLTTSIAQPVTTDDSDPKAPYAVPTMMVTTVFHGASAGYAYIWWVATGQIAYGVGMIGYAAIAFVGVWCALFASSGGKINRKTGVDKRSSGFPFANQEADKRFAGKKSL